MAVAPRLTLATDNAAAKVQQEELTRRCAHFAGRLLLCRVVRCVRVARSWAHTFHARVGCRNDVWHAMHTILNCVLTIPP